MNLKQHLPWLLLGSSAIILILGFRHYTSTNTRYSVFITEKPQHRTIVSDIKAQGILIPNNIIQVGNLIDGIIRYLYVEENDLVEQHQILAEIDDSLDDSGINTTFGNLDAAQANLNYRLEFLKRQQQLFACKQISLDTYQQAERDYQAACATVEATKGTYENAKLVYNNKRVRSPVSGMIIAKNVSIGQAVNNFSPPTVLYSIATDIQTLYACICVDLYALERLELNMSAQMTMNIYPHRMFTGIIHEIKQLPHYFESSDYPFARLIPKYPTTINYCAIAPINNNDLSLRPGMAFTASITSEKENVLSIPNKALKVNRETMQKLAHELKYGYRPLDNAMLPSDDTAKTIWILQHNTFIEKAVTIGIKDNDFVEITSGLDGSEDIVLYD